MSKFSCSLDCPVTLHQRVVESIAPHPSRLLWLQQWPTNREHRRSGYRLTCFSARKIPAMDIAHIMAFQSVKRLG